MKRFFKKSIMSFLILAFGLLCGCRSSKKSNKSLPGGNIPGENKGSGDSLNKEQKIKLPDNDSPVLVVSLDGQFKQSSSNAGTYTKGKVKIKIVHSFEGDLPITAKDRMDTRVGILSSFPNITIIKRSDIGKAGSTTSAVAVWKNTQFNQIVGLLLVQNQQGTFEVEYQAEIDQKTDSSIVNDIDNFFQNKVLVTDFLI